MKKIALIKGVQGYRGNHGTGFCKALRKLIVFRGQTSYKVFAMDRPLLGFAYKHIHSTKLSERSLQLGLD